MEQKIKKTLIGVMIFTTFESGAERKLNEQMIVMHM